MRFTVKAKLASAFGVIIALSMVAGGVAYQKLGDMMSTTDTMVLRAKRMERAMEIEKQLLSQVRAEKNAIIGTEAEAAEFAAEALRSRESVLKTKDEVYALASEDGKKLLDNFATIYAKMVTYQDEEFKLAETDKAQANEHSRDGQKIVNDALAAMSAYVTNTKKQMAEHAVVSKEEGLRAQSLLLTLIGASLAIAIAAAIWISLNISRSLARAVDLAGSVAKGDLSHTIPSASNDEVGDLIRSLNMMVEKLRQIVAEALTAAQNVSAGSQELSASAEQLSQGATEQVKMTERFTAASPDVVEWRVTYEDSNTWTGPWTFAMPLTKVDRTQQMFEYACHEGNLAMRHILSAQRAEEKAAVGAAK